MASKKKVAKKKATRNKVGRPTKYNEKMLSAAADYLTTYSDYGHIIPSVVGLAVVLGIGERTLYTWGEVHEEFQQILDRLQSHQHFNLVNGGLRGDLNPTITKLVLGKHGYHEKQDHQHSGPNGGALEYKLTVTEDDTSVL